MNIITHNKNPEKNVTKFRIIEVLGMIYTSNPKNIQNIPVNTPVLKVIIRRILDDGTESEPETILLSMELVEQMVRDIERQEEISRSYV